MPSVSIVVIVNDDCAKGYETQLRSAVLADCGCFLVGIITYPSNKRRIYEISIVHTGCANV